MNALDEFQWVSVSEASRRLGISPSEVRRRIRVGQLVGERQPRGPGDSRDRFVVQVPTTLTERGDDALLNTQTRADSEDLVHVISALIQSHAGVSARQGEMIAELREERGRLQAERDDARRRVTEAEEDLNYLRIDLRREQEYAKERVAVLKARDQRIEEMEVEVSALRAVPWWRRWWSR